MYDLPEEEGDVILGNMKSLHVHVILRTQVGEKLYRMTDYFTWMYENHDWMVHKNPEHHPIKRMRAKSKVMLLHQDMFLVEDTLKEIAKIFETVVTWDRNSQTLQQLKSSMALFLHLMTHNIRDVRGTAAENEWLERAIYKSLGVECIQKQNQLVDLEAFANPLLSVFTKVYDQMTELKFQN